MDFLAALDCVILKALHQFREKWVRDVGDNQAQHAAPARNQSARVGVRIEIHLLDHLAHSLRCARLHFVRIIDRP